AAREKQQNLLKGASQLSGMMGPLPANKTGLKIAAGSMLIAGLGAGILSLTPKIPNRPPMNIPSQMETTDTELRYKCIQENPLYCS
ncbi:MAG TPA: hypothetical protein PLQ36_00435, partial [Candidatus Gracilibacteria bacterium]|nr:hypothetical protein [Candidatus Gracilibacteria bacterium]